MRSVAKRLPADFLLSIVFLSALALLILNDFVLKSRFPGFITGKVSDVVGPVVVALLAVAALEFVMYVFGKAGSAKPWWFIASAIVVVCLFAAIKLTEPGSAAYVSLTTSLLDLVRPVAELFTREWTQATPEPVPDVWDVAFALLAIPITFATGLVWRRQQAPRLGQRDGDAAAE